MPQMGFFLGGAGAGIFGIPAGVAHLVIAWDQYNQGSGSQFGVVYQATVATTLVGGGRIRSKAPFQVASYSKPHPTSSFCPLGLDKVRFTLAGHSNLTDWVEITLKALDADGNDVYLSTSGTGKSSHRVQIEGFMTGTAFDFEDEMDQLVDVAQRGFWHAGNGDLATRSYENLMTPNAGF